MMFARLQAWVATHALVLGLGAVAGAGAVLAWERHAPFGLGLAQRHAAAVAELVKAGDQVVGLTADRDGWRDAHARCEAVRAAETGAAAERVAADSADRAKAAAGAFDQGYAAGRAVGRRSCTGGTDAKPKAAAAADPVGELVERVRDDRGDFAAAWKRGAYQPGGPVSAGAGRAVDR